DLDDLERFTRGESDSGATLHGGPRGGVQGAERAASVLRQRAEGTRGCLAQNARTRRRRCSEKGEPASCDTCPRQPLRAPAPTARSLSAPSECSTTRAAPRRAWASPTWWKGSPRWASGRPR